MTLRPGSTREKLLKAIISMPQGGGGREWAGQGAAGRWVAGALLEASGAGRGQEPRRGRLLGSGSSSVFPWEEAEAGAHSLLSEGDV